MTIDDSDALLRLLRDFFNLLPDFPPEEITQKKIGAWDSLAMVQLIADLQGTFLVDFDLDEIGTLRCYEEIRDTLIKKGISLTRTTVTNVHSENRHSDKVS